MLPCLQFAISLLCFRIVINLTNFFALPGIRTQTDHLQGDLDVLVLVVYLKTMKHWSDHAPFSAQTFQELYACHLRKSVAFDTQNS